MDPIIALCGNRCDLCPLYRENFEKLGAEKVNAGFCAYYQGGVGVLYRGCDGCSGSGYQPRPNCPISTCATARGLENCAACPDLFCGLLESDMKVVEGAVQNFAGAIPAEDFDIFFKPFLTRERLTELRARS